MKAASRPTTPGSMAPTIARPARLSASTAPKNTASVPLDGPPVAAARPAAMRRSAARRRRRRPQQDAGRRRRCPPRWPGARSQGRGGSRTRATQAAPKTVTATSTREVPSSRLAATTLPHSAHGEAQREQEPRHRPVHRRLLAVKQQETGQQQVADQDEGDSGGGGEGRNSSPQRRDQGVAEPRPPRGRRRRGRSRPRRGASTWRT